MNTLYHLAERYVDVAFWYCCDFMVNLANLTHTSYDEANTWVLLVGVRVVQWFQLRWLRRVGR